MKIDDLSTVNGLVHRYNLLKDALAAIKPPVGEIYSDIATRGVVLLGHEEIQIRTNAVIGLIEAEIFHVSCRLKSLGVETEETEIKQCA